MTGSFGQFLIIVFGAGGACQAWALLDGRELGLGVLLEKLHPQSPEQDCRLFALWLTLRLQSPAPPTGYEAPLNPKMHPKIHSESTPETKIQKITKIIQKSGGFVIFVFFLYFGFGRGFGVYFGVQRGFVFCRGRRRSQPWESFEAMRLERSFGKGNRRSQNQWRKALFRWMVSRHSVDEGDGKDFFRYGHSLMWRLEGNSLKWRFHESPDSNNWNFLRSSPSQISVLTLFFLSLANILIFSVFTGISQANLSQFCQWFSQF